MLEDFDDRLGLQGRLAAAYPPQNIAGRRIEILHVDAIVAEVWPAKIGKTASLYPAAQRGLPFRREVLACGNLDGLQASSTSRVSGVRGATRQDEQRNHDGATSGSLTGRVHASGWSVFASATKLLCVPLRLSHGHLRIKTTVESRSHL